MQTGCMDKVSSYFKDCWKPLFKGKSHNRPSHGDSPAPNEQPQTEREEPTECVEEESGLLDLTDVFDAFKNEVEESWQNYSISPIWSGRSFGDDFSDLGSEEDSRTVVIAKHLLRHALSVSEIYNHFLLLDPKRCCLPSNTEVISSIQSTGTLRTVQKDGVETRRRAVPRVQAPVIPADVFLDSPEKNLYKRVLLCAKYPVLSSPISEPSDTPMATSATSKASPNLDDSVLSPTDKISIEPEMLMTYIRESFGITERIHEQYLNEVRQSIPNGSQSRLLLRELQERLYQLETNQHYYYKIGCFLDRDGYPRWRSREIDFTKKLIRKFWKSDIPRNIGSQVRHINGHEEYKQLQDKLFKYEMNNRRSTNDGSLYKDDEVVSVFPVSSAARKLLKEFGLRYGVCSLYRQITSLVCLAENFEYCGWYFKCVTQAIFEMKRSLQNYYDILVHDECRMLKNALNLIHEHIGHTLRNARKLFPSKIPFDVVSWILEMLKAIIKMEKDLGMENYDDLETEEQQIRNYFQEAVEIGYNRVKEPEMVFTNSVITTRVLRKLLLDLRQELEFYKEFENQCPDVSRYMDVTNSVSKKLYTLLMKDTKNYFISKIENPENQLEVDFKDLRLAYLFAKLDKDWELYIAPSIQKWRIYIMFEIKRIMRETVVSARKLLRVFIRKDELKTIAFKFPNIDEDTITSHSSRSTLTNAAPATPLSVSSVLQSQTSAFERIMPRCDTTDSKSTVQTHKTQRSVSDASNQNGASSSSNRLPCDRDKGKVSSTNDGKTKDKDNVTFLPINRKPSVQSAIDSEQTSPSFHSCKDDLPFTPASHTEADDISFGSSQYETPSEGDEASLIFPNSQGISYASNEGDFESFIIQDSLKADWKIENPEAFARDFLDDLIAKVVLIKEGKTDMQDSLSDKFANLSSKSFKRQGNQKTGHLSVDTGYISLISNSSNPSPLSGQIPHPDLLAPVAVRPTCKEDSNFDKLNLQKSENSIEDSKLLRNGSVPAIGSPAVITEDNSLNKCFDNVHENGHVETKSKRGESDSTVYTDHSTEISDRQTYCSQLTQDVTSELTQDGTSVLQTSTESSEPRSEVSSDCVPEAGQILISSSLADTLIAVFRLSGFYSKLCELLVPETCHERFISDLQMLKSEHEAFRDHLYNGLMQTINKTLVTYADGILALDICGWNEDDLENILGHQLIRRLREEQKSGLISGCRHDLSRRLSDEARLEGICVNYCPQVARVIKYCIGEWETISAKICTRLNNIKSLIDVMPMIELQAKRAFGTEDSDLKGSDLTEPELVDCRKDLQAVWESQISILAQRIATMFGKIVDVLWTLDLVLAKDIPYGDQLKPLSVFLECQLVILRQNLYPVSLRRVVEDLWQRILVLFRGFADKLRETKVEPFKEAKRCIQLMTICLKHLVVDAQTDAKLMTKCSPILSRFRLHFFSTEKLQRVLDVFRKLESDGQAFMFSLTPKEILLDLLSAGGLKRVFSGADFVNSLLDSKIWLPQFDNRPTDEEAAISIGNELLNDGKITCVTIPSHEESGIRTARSRSCIAGIIEAEGVRFCLFAGSEDENDTDSLTRQEGFQNSPDFIYKIEAAACNVGDPEIIICRVIRQAGLSFSLTIQQDVISILKYRCQQENDQRAKNILNTISSSAMRPKASSWPRS
ncbi:uncharacterized protein LOC135696529 isoform X2 [Rhopilema esculentum]|uniref:uncharacterized protein LOC135696529 isoform X2 n=1 Tax=Rhopilema esculentum TaxID=499914 RepID=UPI0031E0A29F